MGYLYLLHYARSLSGKGNSHYLGYSARKPSGRIAQHAKGAAGVVFTTEAHRQGIPFTVAGTWPGCTPNDERRMKRQKQHRRFCTVCVPGTTRRVPPVPRNEYLRRGETRPDPGTFDDLEDLPY